MFYRARRKKERKRRGKDKRKEDAVKVDSACCRIKNLEMASVSSIGANNWTRRHTGFPPARLATEVSAVIPS